MQGWFLIRIGFTGSSCYPYVRRLSTWFYKQLASNITKVDGVSLNQLFARLLYFSKVLSL